MLGVQTQSVLTGRCAILGPRRKNGFNSLFILETAHLQDKKPTCLTLRFLFACLSERFNFFFFNTFYFYLTSNFALFLSLQPAIIWARRRKNKKTSYVPVWVCYWIMIKTAMPAIPSTPPPAAAARRTTLAPNRPWPPAALAFPSTIMVAASYRWPPKMTPTA